MMENPYAEPEKQARAQQAYRAKRPAKAKPAAAAGGRKKPSTAHGKAHRAPAARGAASQAQPEKELPWYRKPLRKQPLWVVWVASIGRGVLLAAEFWLTLAALAAIALFMFWYGYEIDRNGWFQGEQYEREVALAMLDGHPISNFAQMEEREITKLYVQNLDEAPRSVAIGSSRILQLDRELAGDETFFNAGMIGAEYADTMDSYYLFDRVDRNPQTVIFGVDPWLFSAGPDANTFKRVDMQMYNEFLRYGLGHTDVEVTPAEENMNFWQALTSPAFFHETIDYYIDNKENGLRPSVLEGDISQEEGDVKMPDGSVVYGLYLRERSQDETNNEALVAITSSLVNCEDFYELDPEHTALFDEFVRYMQNSGSQVVFFLTPYNPIAYDWILNFPQRYSGFFQVENWLRQYAAEHGIPVYGSYDPTVAGCDYTDFFDAWHVKGTGIAKFFPGVAAIDAARAAGTLPDPLSVSPRLPTATEDAVLP